MFDDAVADLVRNFPDLGQDAATREVRQAIGIALRCGVQGEELRTIMRRLRP